MVQLWGVMIQVLQRSPLISQKKKKKGNHELDAKVSSVDINYIRLVLAMSYKRFIITHGAKCCGCSHE